MLVQWSCAIQARSKRLSILQRPFNNWVLTFALVFETILAFLIIYSPGATSGLQLAPLSPLWYVVQSNIKWSKQHHKLPQVATRLCLFPGTHLLWRAEESHLKVSFSWIKNLGQWPHWPQCGHYIWWKYFPKSFIHHEWPNTIQETSRSLGGPGDSILN